MTALAVRADDADAARPRAVGADGELNGVAELLKMVIEEKLEEGLYKQRQFDRMKLIVSLLVTDVGASATTHFKRGSAVLSSGAVGRAQLKVECDNETVTQFTCFTLLPGGLPNFFDANGRSIVKKLLTRKLVIRGLLRHLVGLIRFIRLFSIPEEIRTVPTEWAGSTVAEWDGGDGPLLSEVVEGHGELNGVAELLKTVIEEKLEEGLYKQRQFNRMKLNVLLDVTDVGQTATIDFRRSRGFDTPAIGHVTLASGSKGKAQLKVKCDNETVTQFTCFTLLPGGLPNFFDPNGKSIVKKLLTRKLVIRGLIRHLPGLVLFIRLFSIPRDEQA